MSVEITPWLRYLITFLIVCHGYVYIPLGTFMLDVEKQKEWRGHSWLLGKNATQESLKSLVRITHILTGFVIIAGGIAFGFSYSRPDLWKTLLIAGSIAGIAVFTIFWDGQIKFFVEEGGLGMFINLMILVFVWIIRSL